MILWDIININLAPDLKPNLEAGVNHQKARHFFPRPLRAALAIGGMTIGLSLALPTGARADSLDDYLVQFCQVPINREDHEDRPDRSETMTDYECVAMKKRQIFEFIRFVVETRPDLLTKAK